MKCLGWVPWLGKPENVRKGWFGLCPAGRTLRSVERRVQEFERTAVRRGGASAGDRYIELGVGQGAMAAERLRNALASYSGHLRHGVACREWACAEPGAALPAPSAASSSGPGLSPAGMYRCPATIGKLNVYDPAS